MIGCGYFIDCFQNLLEYVESLMRSNSFLLVAFPLFFLNIFAGGNSYSGIFTTDIYKQDDILQEYEHRRAQAQLSFDQQAELERGLNIELEMALISLKKMKIEEKVVGKIEAQVGELIRREQRGAEKSKKRAVVNIIAGVFDFIGSFATLRWGDSVRAVTQITDSGEATTITREGVPRRIQLGEGARRMTSGIATLGTAILDLLDASEILNGKVNDVFEKAEEIGLSVAEFKWDRDQLLNLDNDPWHSSELVYVKKKRFFPTNFQQSVENKFLTTRDSSGTGAEMYRLFFDNALCMPVKKKQIGRDQGPDISARLLLQRFMRDRNFQNYAPEEQEELKRFMITTLYASRASYLRTQRASFEDEEEGGPATPLPSKPYLRRGFYLYGPPGAGKTLAAVDASQFLGLPYCQKTLLGAEDITRSNLLGSEFWRGNPGWLAEALLTRDAQGKTFRNPILILDDFDRILVGVGKEKSPIPFLLWLLDPGTTVVKSPFFEADLDIGDMFFLLTGNQKLHASPVRQAAGHASPVQQDQDALRKSKGHERPLAAGVVEEVKFDDMQALERRLKTVTFRPFTQERRESILRTQMANLIYFFRAQEYQPQVQDFLIGQALRERDLSNGLILLSERMLDYKINMLSAPIA